mmetsp:Transcript_59569/g.174817  ORF Transcript_59569/g.174817 Transcript_59569/m.174817 type:complete len:200 (-) Transcript_59569:554-1153(-)
MPSYITAFQFSPERIWKIVTMLHQNVSKWARGTHVGLPLPSSPNGHRRSNSSRGSVGMTAPVSGSKRNLPPMKLCPMRPKTQMMIVRSSAKSPMPSRVPMLALRRTFMFLNLLASLKILRSLKALRAEIPPAPPSLRSREERTSKTENSTMTPSKASRLSDQYAAGSRATCRVRNSNRKMVLKVRVKPSTTHFGAIGAG